MSQRKDTIDTITPKIVFGQLFKSRNTMHIVHLRTESRATHDTCQNYYETLLPLIDDLIETHFGVTGRKELDMIPSSVYVDPVEHMNDMMYYITSSRKIFNTTQEANIIDEILHLISHTKYRLTLE